MMTVQHKKV